MNLYLYKPGLRYALDSNLKLYTTTKMSQRKQTSLVKLISARVGQPFVLTQLQQFAF